MQIEFLGTGGYFANERRHTACIFLPELGIVLDAGSGVFRLLTRLQTDDLHIFLTHSHLDHIVGLPVLLIPSITGRLQRIKLFGSSRTLDAVETHLFAEEIFPVRIPFERQAIQDAGGIEIRPQVTVHWQQLTSHPGGSIAYRVRDERVGAPRSFAYITDTSLDGTYNDFIRDVNVLIHECYFSDEQVDLADRTGHSTTTGVAQLAADTGVQRLILVHPDPTLERDDPASLDAMRSIFPDVTLATDGLIVNV